MWEELTKAKKDESERRTQIPSHLSTCGGMILRIRRSFQSKRPSQVSSCGVMILRITRPSENSRPSLVSTCGGRTSQMTSQSLNSHAFLVPGSSSWKPAAECFPVGCGTQCDPTSALSRLLLLNVHPRKKLRPKSKTASCAGARARARTQISLRPLPNPCPQCSPNFTPKFSIPAQILPSSTL